MSKNLATAKAYYTALGQKDLTSMGNYLHQTVNFIGPLAQVSGKENVLETARRIIPMLNGVKIRANFGEGDQAMVSYDLDLSPPIGIFRVAALLTFKEDLISCIELFYDPRPLGCV